MWFYYVLPLIQFLPRWIYFSVPNLDSFPLVVSRAVQIIYLIHFHPQPFLVIMHGSIPIYDWEVNHSFDWSVNHCTDTSLDWYHHCYGNHPNHNAPPLRQNKQPIPSLWFSLSRIIKPHQNLSVQSDNPIDSIDSKHTPISQYSL